MKILFYSSHTLYAKVLIPIIIKLLKAGHMVYISENRPEFARYDPHRYAAKPFSNMFVNRSSYDYVAGSCGYAGEWNAVKDKVRFTFFSGLRRYDAIFGTTKNLDILKRMKKSYPARGIFAIGYQHMPFVISLGGLRNTNMPDIALKVFTEPNLFSDEHRFREYISDYKISFRGFPYLEKAYSGYYLKYLERVEKGQVPKRYALIFHPGGYRGVITNLGEGKEPSYRKQSAFFVTVCGPILERGLIPVVKIHPMAARYHFKEDIMRILDSLTKENKDFSKVIVDDEGYYRYVYESDTVVTFGSSGIYELFSMKCPNLIICDFLGKARSKRFSFFKGIFISSVDRYRDFWRQNREFYFSNAYSANSLLESVYQSYSSLFRPDISEKILEDVGIV